MAGANEWPRVNALTAHTHESTHGLLRQSGTISVMTSLKKGVALPTANFRPGIGWFSEQADCVQFSEARCYRRTLASDDIFQESDDIFQCEHRIIKSNLYQTGVASNNLQTCIIKDVLSIEIVHLQA